MGNSSATDIDTLVKELRELCCQKIDELYSKIKLLDTNNVNFDKLYVNTWMLDKPLSKDYKDINQLAEDSVQDADLKKLEQETDDFFFNFRRSFSWFSDRTKTEHTIGFERYQSPPKQLSTEAKSNQVRKLRGIDFAQEDRFLMVLGKPGTGKTLFLRDLAIACCKRKRNFLCTHIPILIELREYSNAGQFNLLDIIRDEFEEEYRNRIEEILYKGRFLILLDGLDEVPENSRQDIQKCIGRFSKKYLYNHFILTCRTQAAGLFILDQFHCVEIDNFDENQIREFAEHWFSAQNIEIREQEKEFIEKLINTKKYELAFTPILLDLICQLFNGSSRELPSKRSELYRKAIDLLLEKRDNEKGRILDPKSEIYSKLNLEDKQKLLAYIACQRFKEEQSLNFSKKILLKDIKEQLRISSGQEEILQDIEIQSGLLTEKANEIYSFSHQTFQEYFIAQWYVDYDGQLEDIVSHCIQTRWQEVFLLTSQMLNNRDEILKFLKLMKEQIDNHIRSQSTLQYFLSWINKKSCSLVNESFPSTEKPYKLVALRAFYFRLVCSERVPDLEQDFELVSLLDSKLARNFKSFINMQQSNNSQNQDDDNYTQLSLNFSPIVLSLLIDYSFYEIFYFTDVINSIEKASNEFRNYISRNPKYTGYEPPNSSWLDGIRIAIDTIRSRIIGIMKLSYHCQSTKHDFDTYLQDNLQDKGSFVYQMVSRGRELYKVGNDMDSLKAWVDKYMRNWCKEVNTNMTRYRDINRNWSFHNNNPESNFERKLLKEYYDATNLLVNCLNHVLNNLNDQELKSILESEIQDKLFLPIDPK
nr:NACHT domain-containing protein [Nostoc sp. ChiQUE02]MDZ8233980.1 NACHT domain-containing protein [Nostoc sp. ChiQUE02]